MNTPTLSSKQRDPNPNKKEEENDAANVEWNSLCADVGTTLLGVDCQTIRLPLHTDAFGGRNYRRVPIPS